MYESSGVNFTDTVITFSEKKLDALIQMPLV
jgi:hypothetical protein